MWGLTVLVAGILASMFVGFNIGGSSTGIAWGPAVGAGVLGKAAAGALMTFFVLLGGWTVGRNVLETLSGDLLTSPIGLQAGVAVLVFIGLGILIANVFGVPVPTSMTTVGAIAGLGLATQTLNVFTIAWILAWWTMAPFLGFWVGMIVGRYAYSELNQRFQIQASEGPLFSLDRGRGFPTPRLGPGTTWTEVVSTGLVLVIGSYMAFSAGASNVPNAVAPLTSSGALGADVAILIATVAIGLGGFTIARRTLESVGSELSEIPLLAALLVMSTSATITTLLSYLGVPISLVLATVATIVGLGWGRASRPFAAGDFLRGKRGRTVMWGALAAEPLPDPPRVGEAEPDEVEDARRLFNPRAIAKYVSMWILGPSCSLILSYVFFRLLPGVA